LLRAALTAIFRGRDWVALAWLALGPGLGLAWHGWHLLQRGIRPGECGADRTLAPPSFLWRAAAGRRALAGVLGAGWPWLPLFGPSAGQAWRRGANGPVAGALGLSLAPPGLVFAPLQTQLLLVPLLLMARLLVWRTGPLQRFSLGKVKQGFCVVCLVLGPCWAWSFCLRLLILLRPRPSARLGAYCGSCPFPAGLGWARRSPAVSRLLQRFASRQEP